MERHRCKLCFKSFSNGRALGGHMRSHMLNLPIPPKPDDNDNEEELQIQLSQDTESASSSSSSSSDDDDEEKEINNLYGLRENPKRSIRMVDPEFSSLVLLQDRESETESSKNPTRRRSKRTRKLLEHQFRDLKKLKFTSFNHNKTTTESSSWPAAEAEQPVSSISDTTTEEDVAFCLMMLSRDNKWRRNMKKKTEKFLNSRRYEEDEDDDDDDDDEEHEETEESDESKSFFFKSSQKNNNNNNKGKYKCDTCNKVFKSYQALGGHRASHKKLRLHNHNHDRTNNELESENNNAVTSSSVVVPVKKIHECPYCLRVFSSGQALGGHKRSHVSGVASNSPRISTKIEASLNLIDLNLPAPIEEDDVSQIELSAVSDAEFVNNHHHIKR